VRGGAAAKLAAVAPFLLLAALAAEAPEPIFACSFGARQVEIVRDGQTLTYRFGRPGRPELVLTGGAARGNLFYHRTLYPRGEAQSLRFVRGATSYAVFNIFQTPDYREEGAIDESGLVVLRRGRAIRRLTCRGGGDLIENPLFEQLPRDEEDPIPRR
jgi:hypothetical protein